MLLRQQHHDLHNCHLLKVPTTAAQIQNWHSQKDECLMIGLMAGSA